MLAQYFLLIFAVVSLHSVCSQDESEELSAEDIKLSEREKELRDYITPYLDHYIQPDPVGFPGVDVPDPYPVPDVNIQEWGITAQLMNTSIYGFSKFRVVSVNIEVSSMQIQGTVTVEKLQACGNYTMSTWLSATSGPFRVDVTGLEIKARASLGVERDGKLRAQDIDLDLATKTTTMKFDNMGFFGGVFQGFINFMSSTITDLMKPHILKEAYTKMRSKINSKLDEVAGAIQFPNSISPLDMYITSLRKKVNDMDLDPYKVINYNTAVSVFVVKLTDTRLTGISSFQRVGNSTVKMENNTAIVDFKMGTQKLEARTDWKISTINDIMLKGGTASFSVEYITVHTILAQPLDVRKKPELRCLELEVGDIDMRCDGAGTVDYIIESFLNMLPNLLRYQIMDAIEVTFKEKIQQELSEIYVEQIILQIILRISEMDQNDFKPLVTVNSCELDDEDEFFHF